LIMSLEDYPARLQAHELIGFAFDHKPNVAESSTAATLLSDAIDGFQTASEPSGIDWRDCSYDTKIGQSTKLFPDGSELVVYIADSRNKKADPDNPWDTAGQLYVNLRVGYPNDPARMVRAGYRAFPGQGTLICETDEALGMSILSALEVADSVDAISEDEAMEMLGALLVESTIVKEGLPADIDPEIEALREESEAYREFSDFAREEMTNQQLAQQMGVAETNVGEEEVRKVIQILEML
jgi:hypothetical protein